MNKKTIAISLIVLIIDQFSKILIESIIDVNHSINIINRFFSITIVHNYGISWGMLNGKRIMIILGTILIMLLLNKLIKKYKENTRNIIASGLLLGGIIGNFIDRLFLGYVRDFLDFYIGSYNYPVFNIADTCIVIGIILLIIATLKGEDESDNKSTKK